MKHAHHHHDEDYDSRYDGCRSCGASAQSGSNYCSTCRPRCEECGCREHVVVADSFDPLCAVHYAAALEENDGTIFHEAEAWFAGRMARKAVRA